MRAHRRGLKNVRTESMKGLADDELTDKRLKAEDDLLTGQTIMLPNDIQDKNCNWKKGIEIKKPSFGLFPFIATKMDHASNQIEILNTSHYCNQIRHYGHERSKSVECYLEFQNTKANIKRNRSSSEIACRATENDLHKSSDDLELSLNSVITLSDITKHKVVDIAGENESKKSLLQTRPLFGLKTSIPQLLNNEYMSLKELVDTEWQYLQDLYLIRHFRTVVSKILGQAVKTIFGNIDQLIHFHEILNDDLEVFLIQGSPNAAHLSNIFAARIEDFLAYKEYGNNYQSGKNKLHKLEKKVNARDLFKRIRSQHKSRKLGLESFLICPIQRICKYPLLLKQIIKDFESDGKDTLSLKDALIQVEKIITLINDSMQQILTKKVTKFGNKQFTKPGCSVLKEEKIFLDPEKKNKGYIYLFNDSIVVAKRSWGGNFRTILDIRFADSSLTINQCDNDVDLKLNFAKSSLVIRFKYATSQKSFIETLSSLTESFKASKKPISFDSKVSIKNDTLKTQPSMVGINELKRTDAKIKLQDNFKLENERLQNQLLTVISQLITEKSLHDVKQENLINYYKILKRSQNDLIYQISSCLSIKAGHDIDGSINLINQKAIYLVKLESEFKQLKALQHLAYKENQQLEELFYQGKKNDAFQEKYNHLLKDLHQSQSRLFATEKELNCKNTILKELEMKLQTAINTTHQVKINMSEKERLFKEENDVLKCQIEKLESEMRNKIDITSPNHFYYAMVLRLEKEMLENKNQLVESKEALKYELKTSKDLYDKRGHCIKKLYSQLQETIVEKEKLKSIQKQSNQHIHDLLVEKTKWANERKELNAEIVMIQNQISSMNEKSESDLDQRRSTAVNLDLTIKDEAQSKLSFEKEITVWKTIFFEIEVILGLSERRSKKLPSLDEEIRVANTVSKIRFIKKSIKDAHMKVSESIKVVNNMNESVRGKDVRMKIMAEEIRLKTSEFERQIYEKNIIMDNLIKDKASKDAIQALKIVKEERQNYELRLRDSNSLIKNFSVEISAELENNHKTICDQEIMISDFCINTQRLQSQNLRLRERLENAKSLEADHIFELDKLEKRLKLKNQSGISKKNFKSNPAIATNSATTFQAIL